MYSNRKESGENPFQVRSKDGVFGCTDFTLSSINHGNAEPIATRG